MLSVFLPWELTSAWDFITASEDPVLGGFFLKICNGICFGHESVNNIHSSAFYGSSLSIVGSEDGAPKMGSPGW